MSGIDSINSQLSLQSLYQLLGSQALEGTTQAQDTVASALTGSTSQGASFQSSKAADLFNKLSQLQASDPAKFKAVTADIANKLKAAAAQTTGAQAQHLNDLAAKFQQASDTGDMTALQPAQQQQGHHHHHHYASQTTGSTVADAVNTQTNDTSSSTTQNPMQALWSSIFDEVNTALGTTTGS